MWGHSQHRPPSQPQSVSGARLSYGKIEQKFWTDAKIRAYPEDARHLALYLITSPHRNLLGCYRLPLAYICDDMQWTPDRVTSALAALASGERPFCMRDTDGLTFVVNFLRYHAFASPNHQRAADFLWSQIPRTSPLLQPVTEALAEAWNAKFAPRPKYLEAASQPLLSQIGRAHV